MRARLSGAAAILLLAACSGPFSTTHAVIPTPAGMQLSSPAFVAGGPIPSRFTCRGEDISPPLGWSGVPGSARALKLVMRDPDAPGGDFIHWQLTGIPPRTQRLLAGQIPSGARPGSNSFGTAGYRGPCPPPGAAHHYVITLTATAGGEVVASGTLVGTYRRH